MINNAAKKIVGSQTQIAKHIMANNNIKSQTAHAVAKVVNKTERAVANQVKEIQKKVAEISTGISITVGKDKYNENH